MNFLNPSLPILLGSPFYSSTLAFLIAGQSNASGRGLLLGGETMHPLIYTFGNDYQWRRAYEPIDDPSGQVDAVSDDTGSVTGTNGHSFALRAAKGLLTGQRRINILPCAKGSTTIAEWMPAADRLDRTTLYGSANYRRSVAAPGGLTAIWYFGHEGSAGLIGLINSYIADWTALVAEFRTDYGAAMPFIYAQLAHHTNEGPPLGDPQYNERQHMVAEKQRLLETGSGDAAALAHMHMVVTFDLPLIDQIHLDATAQRTIGDRIALATRQHVLGESVDGTGPRLNGAPTAPATNQVKVDTTQTLATISANADNQFRVYDAGVEMTVSSVVRDPSDASAVLITMSAAATGVVTVSYGNVVASGYGVTLSNVVKNAAGLPLPQFGVQTVV